VIEVIKGERTLNEIAAEYGIHPNLLSRWKTEFISMRAEYSARKLMK